MRKEYFDPEFQIVFFSLNNELLTSSDEINIGDADGDGNDFDIDV